MAPPATPRYRFPSPDDVPRPRTDPPRVSNATAQTCAVAPSPAPAPKPQFATPAPPAARRRFPQPPITQTPGTFGRSYNNRGFSPDPDFFTPSVNQRKVAKAVPGGSTGSKRRRRSFDLDEIDEALLLSGKPRVLGASSGGWKVPAEYFGDTPVPRKIQGLHATPTPSLRRPTFRQSSAIISSPPGDLNLSFGDTQEDVQDDDSQEVESGKAAVVIPRKKRQKSVGVFDDIESIASSLPGTRDEDGDIDVGSDREENAWDTTKAGLRTPPKVQKGVFISNIFDSSSIPPPPPTTALPPGEKWMAVPDQPQLKLPPKSSPTENLNKAICAMAWSPSHRKRRNANSKYLNGGLAATVLGWAYDAQDLVLRSNMVIEQNYNDGSFVVRVILIGDENSGLRKDLGQGSRVEVRPPMWEVIVEGESWTVGINWRLL